MTVHPWRRQDAFKDLCDRVHAHSLVVFSGAGISTQLRTRARPAKGRVARMPSWPELLRRLRNEFETTLRRRNLLEEIDELLDIHRKGAPRASGHEFVEAADIIERAVGRRIFCRALAKNVTPARGETSATHRAIMALDPRAILTFNYDDGHENARGGGRGWVDVVPSRRPAFERTLAAQIRSGLSNPILLKAHGTINARGSGSFVLTWRSYRELMGQSPTYRAFLRYLLVNFDFLFVGFGLEDPDFDQFLAELSVDFDSPVRKHFAIRHRDNRVPRDRVLARRYGIASIYVDTYDQIPVLLQDAAETPGALLARVLDDVVAHHDMNRRRAAHRQLAGLSRPGRRCALRALRSRIENRRTDPHDLTELVYALKYLSASEPDAVTILLRQIARAMAPGHLRQTVGREVVAHAVEALRDAVTVAHVGLLKRVLRDFVTNPPPVTRGFPDPDDRIPTYIQSLIYRARAQALEQSRALRAPARARRRP